MRELPYGNDRLTSKSNAADTRKKQKGGIAQLARASALQAEGRRFDSDYLHKIKTSFGRLFFVEISFDPQSLRDSPQGHAAVVFDAIGHLRPPFSMKTPFLRCAAAAAFAVLRASFFVEICSPPVASRQPRWGRGRLNVKSAFPRTRPLPENAVFFVISSAARRTEMPDGVFDDIGMPLGLSHSDWG